MSQRGRSGRGSYPGRGPYTGRGRGRRQYNKKTEKLYKFHPQGEKMTGKVIATFNLVHEKVVNEMQKVEKYPEDIAESLRKLEIKFQPTVKIIA